MDLIQVVICLLLKMTMINSTFPLLIFFINGNIEVKNVSNCQITDTQQYIPNCAIMLPYYMLGGIIKCRKVSVIKRCKTINFGALLLWLTVKVIKLLS